MSIDRLAGFVEKPELWEIRISVANMKNVLTDIVFYSVVATSLIFAEPSQQSTPAEPRP
jgi:hypothetical protein